MPFEKGESGNTAGRPKGAMNARARLLRQMIILTSWWRILRKYKSVLKKYSPKEKIKCILQSIGICCAQVASIRMN